MANTEFNPPPRPQLAGSFFSETVSTWLAHGMPGPLLPSVESHSGARALGREIQSEIEEHAQSVAVMLGLGCIRGEPDTMEIWRTTRVLLFLSELSTALDKVIHMPIEDHNG